MVEDETMITMILKEALSALGFDVVGLVSKLDIAIRLAGEEVLDAAVLDITILQL